MLKVIWTMIIWILVVSTSTEATESEMLRKGSSVVGMSLNTSVVDYIHPVKSLCDCWKVCRAMPRCTSASVSEDSPKCNVSYRPFTWDNLVQSSGSPVTYFWPPEYELFGKRYYKLYSGTNYGIAKKRCRDEMGQLAILDTQEKFDEVTQYLKRQTVTLAWIGLFIYNASGSEPPVWQYREADVNSTGISWTSKASCFHANGQATSWTLVNDLSGDYKCGIGLQPLCQRDF